MSDPGEIRIGVSACLLGQQVRYDGGHKRNDFTADTLAGFFTLVPVCPEVEIGMGVPRETIRLQGDPDSPRLIATASGADWTARMNAWARRRVRELADQPLHGFIFKKNSPSCGLFRVKVHREGAMPDPRGRGLFAAAFAAANPLVPVEEEGRLADARLRENFIERVFAFHRLQALFAGRWKRGEVIAFHSREKYLLMAHSPRHYKELGRLVAAVADQSPAAFRDRYMALYMECLRVQATTRRNVNALLHVAGHLRGTVAAAEQKRIVAVIEEYGRGLVPLVVPMTLLRHYIELHELPYVGAQTYLSPHPKELLLRNHV